MNQDEIAKILPHRPPFLLVDRVEELEPGQHAVGFHLVRDDEPWVPAHFPGNPIMPGVLVAEALAQVAGIVTLTAHPEYAGQAVYLLGMDKMRFRKIVRPGDELRLEVTVSDKRRRMWFFDAAATVAGDRVADGAFLATVAAAVISG